MAGSSILFGCFLATIFGLKILGKYLFQDPCEGDGNFRDPVDYYTHEEEPEEPEKSEDKENVNEEKKYFN